MRNFWISAGLSLLVATLPVAAHAATMDNGLSINGLSINGLSINGAKFVGAQPNGLAVMVVELR